MNAKRILSLCEQNNNEIANSIYQYYVKRFRAIDGTLITRSDFESDFIFHTKIISDAAEFKFESKKYIASLSHAIPSSDFVFDKKSFTGVISVLIPNSIDWDSATPIFTIRCWRGISRQASSEYFLVMKVGWSRPFILSCIDNDLVNYRDFATQAGVRKIYSLIDSMVKVIRLTPFGD